MHYFFSIILLDLISLAEYILIVEKESGASFFITTFSYNPFLLFEF